MSANAADVDKLKMKNQKGMEPMCQYFKFRKRHSEKVSACWKVCHLLIYATIFVCSFYSAYSFETLSLDLGDHCFLEAKLILRPLETNYSRPSCEGGNDTHTLCRFHQVFPEVYHNESSILWGKTNSCYVYLILEILSTLAGLICFIFTWMIGKGGEGEAHDMIPNPYKCVVPFTMICIVYMFIMLFNTVTVNSGTNEFCAEFVNFTQTDKCTQDLNIIGEAITNEKTNYYFSYKMFIVFTQLTLVAWICQVLLYLLRIFLVVDFAVEKVTVSGGSNKLKSQDARNGLKKLLAENHCIVAKDSPQNGTSI